VNAGTARRLSRRDLAVDRALADIAGSFKFLLDVTPTNLEEARAGFLDHVDETPRFEYRPLEDDPEVIRARLDTVDPEAVDDEALSHLAQAKHRELCLQVEMLAARGTATFRTLSVELFGAVAPSLLAQAEELLRITDAAVPAGEWLDAGAFAERAERELDFYREHHPDLAEHIQVRPDCSAIMVSEANLLIPTSARVASVRADAILQHEIGTHIVTYVNGARQPIRLLAGLAGYDETQEGLALVAEYLVGGLTVTRLRQLAGRVVAVDRMLHGDTFAGVHRLLVATWFSPGAAFVTTMRAFRSGGLTKDAVYLRGLVALVAHIGAGHGIEVLLLGKMPLDAVPIVEALRDRGALVGPTLVPRYAMTAETRLRLDAIRPETTVADLVGSAR
jgi:uncharacterized protein (TIGR02421 family)